MENYLNDVIQFYMGEKSNTKSELEAIESEIEEISKKVNEQNTEKNYQIRLRELRLEKLRDNKEKEIEEYMNEYAGDVFYSGYTSHLRGRLEGAYKEKEESIENEIKALKVLTDEEISLQEKLKTLTLKKEVLLKKQKLNEELKELEFKFFATMLEMKNFKFLYDENHKILNQADYIELTNKSMLMSSRMQEIKELLKTLSEEDIKEVNLNKESKLVEEVVLNKSSEPVEEVKPKEENKNFEMYKILNNAPTLSSIIDKKGSKPVKEIIEGNEKQYQNFEVTKIPKNKPISSSVKTGELTIDLGKQPSEVPTVNDADAKQTYMYQYGGVIPKLLVPNDASKSNEDSNKTDNVAEDIVKDILDDIIGEVKDLTKIKLVKGNKEFEREIFVKDGNEYKFVTNVTGYGMDNTINLPNGHFFDVRDIVSALNEFTKNNKKGKTYVVESTKEKIKLNKRNIKKLKNMLEQAALLCFEKDKSRTSDDVTKIYGKTEGKTEFRMQEVGSVVNSPIDNGYYILEDSLMEKINSLRVKPKLSWLKKISQKLKFYKDEYEDDLVIDLDDSNEKQYKI